jgi:hypothetical protein
VNSRDPMPHSTPSRAAPPRSRRSNGGDPDTASNASNKPSPPSVPWPSTPTASLRLFRTPSPTSGRRSRSRSATARSRPTSRREAGTARSASSVLRDVSDEHLRDIDGGDEGWLTTERPKSTVGKKRRRRKAPSAEAKRMPPKERMSVESAGCLVAARAGIPFIASVGLAYSVPGCQEHRQPKEGPPRRGPWPFSRCS